MRRRTLIAAAAGCLLSCSRAATGITEEPVRFRNGDVSLAGTLFLPASGRGCPAVLVFHGSGPEPRNTRMGRWFAEQGVAALTYDKRGVGESSGDFRTVSFPELVNDGLSGIAFLKGRREIDPRKIGVWGLSQGGWLGPLAASKSSDVSFVIAVSGPGVSPGEQMIFFYANQLRERGIPEDQITEASDLRRKVWRYLSTGDRYKETDLALGAAVSRPWFTALKEQQDGLFKASPPSSILHDTALRSRLWFRSEVNYDPTIALRGLHVPALFLFGEDDVITPVPPSVEVIRRTLTGSGRRDFTIQTFPHANHGIRLTSGEFAPGYLQTMSDWLRARR